MTDTTRRKRSHDHFEVVDQGEGKTAFLCTRAVNIKGMKRPCNGTLYPVDVEATDEEGGRVVRFQCHRCQYDLISYVYAHESLVYPLQHGVVRDVMSLSSGTVAAIARTRDFNGAASGPNLDAIQRTWWAWVEDQAWDAVTYERWQDAWAAWVLYQNVDVFDAPADYEPTSPYARVMDANDREAVYGDAVVDTLSKSAVVAYLRQEYEAVKAGERAWVERSVKARAERFSHMASYDQGVAQGLASGAARLQRALKELTGEEVR